MGCSFLVSNTLQAISEYIESATEDGMNLEIELGMIYDIQTKNRLAFTTAYPTVFKKLPGHLHFKKGVSESIYRKEKQKINKTKPEQTKEVMKLYDGSIRIERANKIEYKKFIRQPLVYINLPDNNYDLVISSAVDLDCEETKQIINEKMVKIKEKELFRQDGCVMEFIKLWDKNKEIKMNENKDKQIEIDYRIICQIERGRDESNRLDDKLKLIM